MGEELFFFSRVCNFRDKRGEHCKEWECFFDFLRVGVVVDNIGKGGEGIFNFGDKVIFVKLEGMEGV